MVSDNTESPQNSASTGERTLKWAGMAYLIGDAAMIGTGLLEKDRAKVWGGLWWGAGGVATAIFGNPSAEKQLEILSNKLGAHLKQQGVVIPDTPRTHDLAKDGGVIDHIKNFLYTHPSETLNAVYAIGAGQVIRSGLKKGGAERNNADIASGVLVASGALAGLLIPERKPEEGKKPEGFKEWVQEKPLRVSGGLYAANNVAMFIGAEKKRKAGGDSKSHITRYVTTALYILANTLLYSSSRGQTDDSKHDLTTKLSEAAAQVVAGQPKDVQEALVQDISHYLAGQAEIKRTPEEIAGLLHSKLAEVQPGRWQKAAMGDPVSVSR